ncbi:hypothetical protein F4815DRAFT_481663 [Daldinia loculata]|nr:hypothetical protein F4815DRAFT_481663 [Daldinia loculata]
MTFNSNQNLAPGGYFLSFTSTLGSQTHQSCGGMLSRTEEMWLPQPTHVVLWQVEQLAFIHIVTELVLCLRQDGS